MADQPLLRDHDHDFKVKSRLDVTKTVSEYSLPVNGGHDSCSYSKNSYYQRLSANVEKRKIDEEIAEKLDVLNFLSTWKTIRIADLGCATGPNTFNAMQDLIEAIVHKYKSLCPTSPLPEFQVFFNDQASNDFNSLFNALPAERQYFAVGVPGSFHGRLFPESSLHFVYTCYALQWLSALPEELSDKNSPICNKGRVHYTNAPHEVLNAYSTQFAMDVENFLNARAKELVPGGMMVMILSGIPTGMPYSEIPTGIMFDFISSILMNMAIEGLINEDEVDSFNIPFYAASPEEMTGLVERNGYFSIERMELTNPATWLGSGPIDIRAWMMHVRAAMEGIFTEHFSRPEIIDQMFQQMTEKLSDCSEDLKSRSQEKVQLFVVLKRK
ncbi:hypothetical protein F2P56_035453 [Juglans regia]|uniref:Loganic acid O-methyltransferase-like n=2 Tax=Juglans regia TaxID=51240 RepID=A0A2I4HKF8_JUGRE|nr:loganic acid O-methyltransferase-like [Juglans regia]KAF5442835.1 hypothetical protein F2P56_035453 [Juglans regia]